MKTHILGISVVLAAIVLSIVIQPAPTATAAVALEPSISLPAKTNYVERYIGKECTTQEFEYKVKAETSAECSGKEHPYVCMARCNLYITNQELEAGDFNYETTFDWQNQQTTKTNKQTIPAGKEIKFEFTFPYRASTLDEAPHCTFQPRKVPESTRCVDVERTRRLP